MAIVQCLCGFAVRQLVEGACSTVGISGGGEAVVGFLAQRFTDHSEKLTDALECANERAWKALEIALAGESFWDRCKVVLSSGEDKAFGRQVRAFLDTNPPSTDGAEFRDQCLRELRTARNKKLLTGGGLDPKALAEQAGAFARFADPQAVLAAEWQAVDRMAQELGQAGLPGLGQLLSARPPQGMPLLVVAVRYFFRRQVETDPQLYQGLAFAQLERLGQGQDAGFAALDAALTQQGQRLDALLGEIQSVVVETHGAVLDLQDQIEGQGEQVRQIGQAVQKLLEQHQLQRRELRPGDSLSIRNDGERQLVKQLVARYRALPEGDRKGVPALLNAVGKLEVVAGDFDAAQKDFQAVALLEQNDKGKAEAHYNAYLTLLEKRDWPGAIQELVKAVKLDAKRFAPFPVGKYQPVRILGAGGFGVAFLCKHKYMDAQVVVKTLALEDLGRDADKVFTEAQVLRQLEHPAIIRISECGYVDAARKSRPYILMDYFQSATLEEYVKKHGPLAVDDLIAVARQVADGLQAAHAKGILHRDVKPANLLVHKDDKGWKVKVIDFGLALRQKVAQKSTSASTARQSKTLIGESIAGTVDYAAPEQMGKREGVAPGPYSDVYGWAKSCCYALFQTTQPLMKHWRSVPTPLAELLEKCLDEDPTKRPQSFADVLAALDKMKAIPARATPPVRPTMERAFAFEEAVEVTPQRRVTAAKPIRSASKLPLLIVGGVALAAVIGMVLLLTVMLLTAVLPSKTAAGMLVVEVDQPGAEVYVDGQRYTITRPGDKEPIQVEVQEGTRQLRVVKGGFETFTKEFSVKSGDMETIRVRLEPAAVASNDTKPAPPPERTKIDEDAGSKPPASTDDTPKKEPTKDDSSPVKPPVIDGTPTKEPRMGEKDKEAATVLLNGLLKDVKSEDGDTQAKAVTGLAKLLKNGDDLIRFQAARALGEAGLAAKSVLEDLNDAEKDADAGVRKEARKAVETVDAAVAQETKAAVQQKLALLLKNLKDPKAAVRQKALGDIGEMGTGGVDASEAVLGALSDKSAAVQQVALDTLEKINPTLHRPVMTLLVDQDVTNKFDAIARLQKLGEGAKPSIPLLVHLYQTQAVKRLGPGIGEDMGNIYSVNLLDAMLAIDPDNKDFQGLALSVLPVTAPLPTGNSGFRASKARAKAISVLSAMVKANHLEASKVVKPLRLSLNDPACLRLAINALGELGPDAKDALSDLRQLKSAPDQAVRDAAVEAVKKIE